MIIVAWLAGVAVLVKREYFKSTSLRLAEAATRVGPGASYYTLTMGGASVGYVSSTIDTTPTGISVQSNTVLAIQALGNIQQTGIVTLFNLTRTLHLVSFEASLTAPSTRYEVRGRAVSDSVLDIDIQSGDDAPQHQRITLDRPLVMSDLVSLRLAVGGQLRPGQSYSLRVFDPILQQDHNTTVTVLAESTMVFADSARLDAATERWVPARWDTVRAFKIGQTTSGLTLESWVDDRGNIVSATTPVFTMQRTAFEIAVENWRRDKDRGRIAGVGSGSDVIQNTAIASNAALQPEHLARLRVRVRNVALPGFDLAGGRQQLAGDTLIVTRETGFGEGPAGPRPFAFVGPLPFAPTDTALRVALAAEPLVQSDDPRIRAQARLIAGRERRAGAIAERLTHWVYDNLEKKITISVPSAVQVLEARRGDCNEHTVLYVALARALGLPARTAAGVVYLRGHFYYHAWPEVWLGQWVAVDPTFNQFPADASHLRFVIGGLARQVELVRLIGRLQLTVIPGA